MLIFGLISFVSDGESSSSSLPSFAARAISASEEILYDPMSSRVNPTNVVAVLMTLYLIKKTYDNAPSWMKGGKAMVDTNNDGKIDDNDLVGSPTAIFAKIKEMMQLSQDICGDFDEMPWYKAYASFMSLVHLMNEIDVNHPNFREDYFAKEGVPAESDELKILCKYLDLAHWAYLTSLLEVQENLKPLGYDLVRHDVITEPGRVGHYIAVNHKDKEVVVAIKGTSTLGDVFTDLIGKAVPHTVEGPEGNQEIRCHEGMYTAALRMMDDTLHLLENLFAPQGYRVTICGHSLGAGVSSLFGVLLKQKMPDLDMKVYAYATPACLSYHASLEVKHFITSIVNNNDCVPRLSLLNLRLMNKLFYEIDKRLAEKGLSPDSMKNANAYFADLMKYDKELLMTTEELTEFFDANITQAEEHLEERFLDIQLFVPGRVVTVWNKTNDESTVNGRVEDGGMQVLRQIFMETNMVSDHSCVSYRQNLTKLLEQTEKTS